MTVTTETLTASSSMRNAVIRETKPQQNSAILRVTSPTNETLVSSTSGSEE